MNMHLKARDSPLMDHMHLTAKHSLDAERINSTPSAIAKEHTSAVNESAGSPHTHSHTQTHLSRASVGAALARFKRDAPFFPPVALSRPLILLSSLFPAFDARSRLTAESQSTAYLSRHAVRVSVRCKERSLTPK